MNLSKEYSRNHLNYTWDIENVSIKNKKLIDLMVEMDGIEFIGYDKFRINLSEIEQDASWFGVYVDLVGIWFGEEARNLISDILLEYRESF